MIRSEEIRNYGKMIAERFSPEKIVLFGSYAYGNPTSDSDVDLLVIIRHIGDPKDTAFSIKNALPRPFPLDLIVRSPQEVQMRLEKNDFFIREILDRGTILYERGN
ncbi:MAG: nucleotidyltransferase domain-containing protein [Candidatus Kapaibacterium sp.]